MTKLMLNRSICCVYKRWSLPYAPYQQLRPGILIPYTKEGMELLCFLPYIIGSKDKMYV